MPVSNDPPSLSSAISGEAPRPTRELKATVGDIGTSPGASTDEPHPGDHVGRYALHERVGVGGMGVVYRAFDPELDRIVAVKLLLRDDGGGSRSSRSGGQRRLLREAQAMARLTHPNVVTVHDVGVHDDRVFVAMEFIEGETLTAWRKGAPAVDEILRVYQDAARGLQAAHDVGLVHRDFKPDNVMLTADGQIRVMDFGLARHTGATPPQSDAETTAATVAKLATVEATVTQGVAGTPAYMAPEQHAGLELTPKTDQFAFCVALYEALYGERPFSGDTVAALAFEVLDGRVAAAPRSRNVRVPAWLRAVILRGLSVDPASRWPSMRALAAALHRRSRRGPWVVAAMATVAVAAWGTTAVVAQPEPCADAAKHMTDVWNPASQETVRSGLAAHGGAWAQDTVVAVGEGLDAYARQWSETSRSLCSEAHEGTLSPRLLDLGMACLRQRSNAMAGLVESLADADPALAERAVSAVATLRPIAPCGDIHALVAEVDPPAQGAVAEEVDAIREQLAAAETLVHAGRLSDARESLDTLRLRAQAVDYPAVQVEVDAVLGVAHVRAGDTTRARALLEGAFWRASSLKHERVAAEIAVEMLGLVGVTEGDFEAAQTWERQAATAVARTGNRTRVAAALHRESAEVALLRGDVDAALESLQQAEAVLGDLLPTTHPLRVAISQNIANVMVKQGRFDEAAAALEPILVATEQRLGPSHPMVATALSSLGAAEIKQGRYDVADGHLRRAAALLEALELPAQRGHVLNNLAIVHRRLGDLDAAAEAGEGAVEAFAQAHGKRHLRYAAGLFSLGSVESQRGNVERSTALHLESLAIREESLGADHGSLAFPLAGIAANHQMQGDLESAEKYFRRALGVLRSAPDNSRKGRALSNLAGVLFERGRDVEAKVLAARALSIVEAERGPHHVQTATALTLVARIDARAGNGDEAVRAAERAVAIHRKAGEQVRVLDAEFALAQGLWARAAAGDRDQALALAKACADGFERMGPGLSRLVGETRGWIAERTTSVGMPK